MAQHHPNSKPTAINMDATGGARTLDLVLVRHPAHPLSYNRLTSKAPGSPLGPRQAQDGAQPTPRRSQDRPKRQCKLNSKAFRNLLGSRVFRGGSPQVILKDPHTPTSWQGRAACCNEGEAQESSDGSKMDPRRPKGGAKRPQMALTCLLGLLQLDPRATPKSYPPSGFEGGYTS